MKLYRFNRSRVLVFPLKLVGPSGEKWAQAIFDTGATYSMFPPSVIDAIGVDLRQSERSVKIITASSVEYVPMVTVPCIEIFGRRIEEVRVVSHFLPPGTPAQGLLGINLLQHFDYELNFSRDQLIIK